MPRRLLISLLAALLAGAALAWWALVDDSSRLVRRALSDDAAVRAEALRLLREAASGAGGQPRLLEAGTLAYLREDERLANAPPQVFDALVDALAAHDAAAPTTVGYPAYERLLVQRLTRAGAADTPAAAARVGADLLREVSAVTPQNTAALARLAAGLAAALDPQQSAATHELLLAIATLAGAQHPAPVRPLLDLALATGDAPLQRDALLLMALLRIESPAPPAVETLSGPGAEAIWLWRARVGRQPANDAPPTHLQPLLEAIAQPQATQPLLPPTPEPILELAYWPVPRWEIALRVEQAGDADLAEALLRDLDDHVRRAGLLSCALLGAQEERINRLTEGDDDLTNRRYALLARLMNATDPAERDRLAEAAIVLAESGEIPADDALFALLAAGSTRGGDWLFDPLTPRRSLDESPLGWPAAIRPPQGASIWPILQRFLAPALQLPANTSDEPAAVRLHADALRLNWLLSRRYVEFDREARTFRQGHAD